jgi:hypothetical protein
LGYQAEEQILDHIQTQQQGHRRQVDTAELQGENPAHAVENRIGGAIQEADDRVVRVGADPGDQGPGHDDEDIDLEDQVHHLIQGTPQQVHAASQTA